MPESESSPEKLSGSRTSSLEVRLDEERSAREIITFLATNLTKPCSPDIRGMMQTVLEYLGKRLDFDRIFIGTIHHAHVEKDFEWLAPGMAPRSPDAERRLMPFESLIFAPLCSNCCVMIDKYSSWDHLPPAFLEWFEKTGATCVMLSFYGNSNSVQGLIGFEKHGGDYDWSVSRRELVQTVVDLLGLYHQRMLADIELRESEQFLKMAQAVAGLICWEMCVGKHVKMFGKCFDTVDISDRIRKLPWDQAFDIYAPPYDERLRAVVENAWRTGEPFVIEAMLRDDEGIERWVEVRAQAKIGEEGNARIYGTTQDIDSRKRMERKLRDVNAKLDDMARRDALTGLLNKREFAKDIQNLCTVFERIKRPLSMVMMDIDHFKIYNDTYGHLAGDDCLRQVGQAISSCLLRDADSAYRYGGEEFAVILPDTNLEGAARVAEKIRGRIEALKLPHEKSSTGKYVTMSVGFATTAPEEAAKPNELIARADAALYRAKNDGRNRVAGPVAAKPAT